ncbi:hypothetical protein [Acrocarpospora catenulata]|uniref:hypothetical protein n=1 Tax=Acrocarpospora catenulata TaxID=2836182 RepID=UPI001BD94172|nr:hypothetical protein [Acrocarpospora catenulata]
MAVKLFKTREQALRQQGEASVRLLREASEARACGDHATAAHKVALAKDLDSVAAQIERGDLDDLIELP